MISFVVKDMTCGHCASTITQAVKAADKDATVQIDLATHRVVINPSEADAAVLSAAITAAGYSPVATQSISDRDAKGAAAFPADALAAK